MMGKFVQPSSQNAFENLKKKLLLQIVDGI